MNNNNEYMYASDIIKAKIIACANPDYWYADKIGKNVSVREMSWQGGMVECRENGFSILQVDLKYKGNPKN